MEHYKVKSSGAHFIDTSSDTIVGLEDIEKVIKEYDDPLEDTNCEIKSKFYRVNSVVFAEPFEEITNENNHHKNAGAQQDDLIVLDNVTVQYRKGKKYRKYHISTEDPSSLLCPQPNCNRIFSTTKLLKAHIRKVHCADKGRYVCETCGVTFSCRYLLARHGAVHSGRTVQCSVCDIVLSERSSLSAHLRTHSGIKPHACAVCGKAFTRKSTLDNHLKFVHRDGQLQCLKCQDRFVTRSQWSLHMATHRAERHDGAPN